RRRHNGAGLLLARHRPALGGLGERPGLPGRHGDHHAGRRPSGRREPLGRPDVLRRGSPGEVLVTGAIGRRRATRLTRSLPAAVAALTVLVVAGLAVLAPLVAPFDPNQPDLAQMSRPPGGRHLLGTD